jgi:predicted ribosomally synthesized peptide with nif11-like leader
MLTASAGGAKLEAHSPASAMSEEQLSALLAKLKEDAGFQEKLKGAADLDAAVGMAKEAGFDVSKADWLRYQAKQTSGKLSDEELESVAGGWYASARCAELWRALRATNGMQGQVRDLPAFLC